MGSEERKQWFRLALRLHKPVHWLQKRMSSSEFMQWMIYLVDEPNEFHREDYYWANIIAEIRRQLGDPEATMEKALLKFNVEDTTPAPPKLSEAEKQEQLDWHKAAVYASLGLEYHSEIADDGR